MARGQRHPSTGRACPVQTAHLRARHVTVFLGFFEVLLLLHPAHGVSSDRNQHHQLTSATNRPTLQGTELPAYTGTLEPMGRRLLDVGSLSTTQFIIVIICSVLGFLLIVAVILLIILTARRQEAVVPMTDPQVLQLAANTVAAAATQHPMQKSPADPYAEYPHPLLLRRQIQAELIAQQQAALRGNGPSIDALALAKQLMNNGQLQAAHSVAYNAGVLHLLPGLQEQMARGGVQMATPYPYHTPESLAQLQQQQRQQQLDYGSYNAVYAQALAGQQQQLQQQQQQMQQQMQQQQQLEQQQLQQRQYAMYAQPPDQQQQYSQQHVPQQYSQSPSQAHAVQYAQTTAQQQASADSQYHAQQQHSQAPQQHQQQQQYTRSTSQRQGDAASSSTAAGSDPHQHQEQGHSLTTHQAGVQDTPAQPHA